MKLVHVPTCPCTPTSLSAPPTVLPPSGSCSRSVARACSHAEPLPQGSLKRCCPPRSAVRRSAQRSQTGDRHRPGRGRQTDLLAPHGRAVRRLRLCHGARASDGGMSAAALKRELALLRSSLVALTAQSASLDDPVAWAERIAGLTLDPWQRDVLLSAVPGSYGRWMFRVLQCSGPQSGHTVLVRIAPLRYPRNRQRL